MALINKLNDFPLQTRALKSGVQAWREAGEGDPLVLLHGISSGSGSWVQQLAGLSEQHRVIAWDAPGYGGSDELPTAQPTAGDYAERLAEWLDALHIERCWLVGHSLGAMMASAFADRYPQRLLGLALASPAQGYGKEDAEERMKIYRKRPAVLEEFGPEGLAARRAAALLSGDASTDQVALVADGMKRLRLSGFSAASWLLANDDIWDYLPVPVAPQMVMCGAADAITPPDKAERLAQRAGINEYKEIPAAGHACYIEAAADVNRMLMQWMSAATATSGGEL
ncbi:MAG: alpha/beta hydrolase [Oleibacter sp.]|nr:alpha/beta hydrolase [Thalassolituus sp.]|tara:strand:+ start:354 stop:1202 length:849 start_codon:yes stop_codon:yes gene_type:complete